MNRKRRVLCCLSFIWAVWGLFFGLLLAGGRPEGLRAKKSPTIQGKKAAAAARRPGGRIVPPYPEDRYSVPQVRSYIGELKKLWARKRNCPSFEAWESRERKEKRERFGKGKPDKGEVEPGGVEYWEAWLHYISMRAWPGDRFDASTLGAGARHREAMPRATARRGDLSFPPRIGAYGNWECLGPANLSIPYQQYYGFPPLTGRINAVAYDPHTPTTVYLGGSSGGVWRSTDAGANWQPLSDAWPSLNVSSIAVDPKNPKTLFVGTGDFQGGFGFPCGLLRSTDGGDSWSAVGSAEFGPASPGGAFAINAVLIDPEDSRRVTVITGRGLQSWHGCIWQSLDGGDSWRKALDRPAPWVSLCAGALSGGVRKYYALAFGTDGAAMLWISEDRGQNWQQASAPLPAQSLYYVGVSLDASPVFPDTVYLLAGDLGKVFKSTDAAQSWQDVTNNFPTGTVIYEGYNFSQIGYDSYLKVSWRQTEGGPADVVYVGLIDLAQSVDGGATWRSIGGPSYSPEAAVIHNDQHSLAFHPTNPGEALVGCDGGIMRLRYDPASGAVDYERLSGRVNTVEFYQGAWHPTNADWALGGTQDNATPLLANDRRNWRCVGGGDGGLAVIQAGDPDRQVCTSNGDVVYFTPDKWETVRYYQPPTLGDRSAFIIPVGQDPASASTLYAGTNYLYRLNLDTGAWSRRLGGRMLAAADGVDVLNVVVVAPNDSQRIYTGSTRGQVWMSTDAGGTWRRLDTGNPALPAGSVARIVVHPERVNEVWVCLSGSASYRLARCLDTDAAAPAWFSADGSGETALPGVSLNDLARDLQDPERTWYAATDVGVFVTTDAGASWADATSCLGLPNVRVNALGAVAGTGYLNAATFGRGMWRIRIAPANPLDINADGAINALDPLLLAGYLAGTVRDLPCGPSCGDVNGDGRVDAQDLLLVLTAVAKTGRLSRNGQERGGYSGSALKPGRPAARR